jgi:hypothetical protein
VIASIRAAFRAYLQKRRDLRRIRGWKRDRLVLPADGNRRRS